MRRVVRIFLWLLLIAAVAGSGTAGWVWYRFTAPGPLVETARAVVAKGSGVTQIGRSLEAAGIVSSAAIFAAGVRLTGRAASLQAGEFEFPAHASMRHAALIVVNGATVKRRLTIPEGLTVAEIAALIGAADGLEGVIGPPPEEGSLLPETYFYSYGDSRGALAARMAAAMNAAIEELWPARAAGLEVATPEEAITLASIIEKETAIPEERGIVSSVFHNRLRRGMRLQSDPTVAYAARLLGDDPGAALTRDHLNLDSPYNTYRVKGLPPGPIANPGIESLRAALRPADTDFLYFVADGNGGHVFARTLAEHNRNVAQWRRAQRKKNAAD